MPLNKGALANQLEDVLERRPDSVPEAAQQWASAYVSYASGALTSLGSLPATAKAGEGTLVGAFTAAFNSLSAASAAAVVSQAITVYWQSMVWAGAAAVGTTVVPGNFALAAALSAEFLDLEERTAAEKASRFADAFDAGAKAVVVSDLPNVQPAPPVVAPIQ